MPSAPGLSVLIVTYEHGDEIAACLDAALAQAGEDLTVDVTVADNASRDDTVARVAARAADGVQLLQMGSNTGFAAAVNAAFDASAGEHVLLLNPDCVMDAGCARALRDHLATRPQVAIAAALLHDPDGTPQLHARRDIGLAGVLWAYTTVGRRADAALRGGRAAATRRYEDLWAGGPPSDPVAVFCPAAACIMARRSDLQPRPLDERFALFFNDGDLCRRLTDAGRGIEIVPAATAAHGYGTSVGRAQRADPARMRAEWVASLRRYAALHWSRPQRAGLTVALLADALAGAALCLARREDPREVRGILGGLGLPGGPPPLLTPVRTVWGRRAPAAAAAAPAPPPADSTPDTRRP
ncbi:MAG TPA: glycosyltransferase family 2 protein [Solirubrobacteraceae bacterium]|nr:glycosyltransferase family 2 protein [Solirubrobacteraceae bacterium]